MSASITEPKHNGGPPGRGAATEAGATDGPQKIRSADEHLPAYARETAPMVMPDLPEEEIQESKVNILLVDDRADKLLALEAVLQDLNENVVTARSGKEALRHLLQTEFAVILLDVTMPGMDGFETASLIRKRPSTEHTPIIFVTSLNQSENSISRGYDLGAVDYILSPIMPKVLRSKVLVFVELFRRTLKIKRQAERLRHFEEEALKRQLSETVDRLEMETKRNRFFTLSLNMLAIADFDGYMLQLNPTWEKVLGYTENELKGRPGMEFVHPDDRERMAAEMENIRQGRSVDYFEGRYCCKDGSVRWLGWTATPFPSEKLIYIFARDITDQKGAQVKINNLNAELKNHVQQLTDTNKELEAFCYSISHDLRAPLRAMRTFSQALMEDYSSSLNEEGRHYLERISHSARYMDAMLHDLLEYSRLTLADLPVLNLDLEHELGEVLLSIESEIKARKAEITIDLEANRAMAHPATFRQVFWNLVSNALKFVPPERAPRIRVVGEAKDNLVTISVFDNGIGIPAEHCSRVFNLFERLHRDPNYPGTGVGLAIVRRAIERMGGHVGVESTPNEGSRFWVQLPMNNA
jgi:PAS domain S-box-containing protein